MRIITGSAKSGKTSLIYNEIRSAAEAGQGMQILLVPEQYSHEAERELCRVCGPAMSLHAEVMSFTGLARWAVSRFGGAAESRLSRSGQILCMAVALRELKPLLHVYEKADSSPDMQLLLCRELERLSQAGMDAETLRTAASDFTGSLRDKLLELAMLAEAAEAVAQRSGATIRSPLEQLAALIEEKGLPGIRHVYFDGFFDFTGLEKKVIFAMLRAGVGMTFCLPGDGDDSRSEHLMLSRMTVEELERKAEEESVPCERITMQTETRAMSPSDAARQFLISNLFRYDAVSDVPAGDAVELLAARTPGEECELAAARILQGVREEGLRWRDYAIAIRGFEDYRDILEAAFQRYEIPLFLTRPVTLGEKLFPVWLQCAYDVLSGQWEADDVCAYLRCGLNGYSEEELDLFCAYLQKWNLKKTDWERKSSWKQHPGGYDQEPTAESARQLARINKMRREISEPLFSLGQAHQRAGTGREHIRALRDFLKATGAAGHLLTWAEERLAAGKLELHAETLQSWEKCIQTMEQFVLVGGELSLGASEFRDLFFQLLAQVDLSIIPVALDRVPAGDFHRIRKRNIRRLLVLGCSDERLPAGSDETSLFSDLEIDLLSEHRIDIGCRETELWREYAMIYHTFTLPSEHLTLSFPKTNLRGEGTQPAFVYSQIARMFSLTPQEPDVSLARLSARLPALGLAARAAYPAAGEAEESAAEWFRRNEPDTLQWLREASSVRRGSLSRESVEALYGRQMHLSPSHLEQFVRCRFAYYCRYGLRAKPDDPAAFQAPQVGNFFHYVLQHVLQEVCAAGETESISEDRLQAITDRHVDRYVQEKLGGLGEKDARFRYLFARLRQDVLLVVKDVLTELSQSDFKPLSFELNVADLNRELPLQDGSVRLTGIADRVDGWEHDGRLYLRVVDYKTGKKQFRLSDVLYGLDTQMLLYLFLITEASEGLYGEPAVSAGISYLPARAGQLSFDTIPGQKELEKERGKEKQRSGALLGDPETVAAWDRGEKKAYLPTAGRDSSPLLSAEQMETLRRNVFQTAADMAEAVKKGNIQANPLVQSGRGQSCDSCSYHDICQFAEGRDGEHSVVLKKRSDEEVWKEMGERA